MGHCRLLGRVEHLDGEQLRVGRPHPLHRLVAQVQAHDLAPLVLGPEECVFGDGDAFGELYRVNILME